MKNLNKLPHADGGFIFKQTESKSSNVELGVVRKNMVLAALKNSDVQGVYETTDKKIKVQYLSGNCTFI